MATVAVTSSNFQETIDNNDIVIVDAWAEWCGPCQRFAPIFEKASEAYDDVVFAKLDTDANQDVAAALQIQSIPTVMIFREQILVFSNAGVLSPQQLDELIGQVRGLDMDEVRKQIADGAGN